MNRFSAVTNEYNDFLNFINSRKRYVYTDNILLKQNFRSTYALSIWSKYEEYTNSIYIKEILSNNIFILSNLDNISIKVAKFLLRNSIDNFVSVFYNSKNISPYQNIAMNDKINYIKRDYIRISEAKNILESIFTLFTECCNYVHSTELDNLELTSYIKQNISSDDTKDYILNELFNSTKNITSILYLMYLDKLSNMQKIDYDYLTLFLHKNIYKNIEYLLPYKIN